MNRRGFLGAILASCAAPAIVKASSLMPVFVRSGGLLVPDTVVSGNRLLTINMITDEALRILEQNLVMALSLSESYAAPFATNTLRIRKPNRFGALNG